MFQIKTKLYQAWHCPLVDSFPDYQDMSLAVFVSFLFGAYSVIIGLDENNTTNSGINTILFCYEIRPPTLTPTKLKKTLLIFSGIGYQKNNGNK